MELMAGAVGCGARVLFCGWGVPEGTWSAGIEALIAAGRFQNETSQIKLLEDGGQMLILLGRPEAEDMRHVKQLIGRAVRMARDEKAGSLEIDLDTWQGTMRPWVQIPPLGPMGKSCNSRDCGTFPFLFLFGVCSGFLTLF